MIYSFPPVIDQDCRVLVLGSMPSVASLERQQYYGNKQNYFWPMLFELLEQPYSEDYTVKKNLALAHHIAIWDVLASCERQGSLDSSITNEVANDLPGLLAQYPRIGHILFNGGKAYQSCKRSYPQLLQQIPYTQMPSTSPAHTMKREEKKIRWQILTELCNSEPSDKKR